jgi:flagellar basal-body rod protein FlgB
MPIQPSLSAALNHRMNYFVIRQGLVSSNIANASTPNYVAKDAVFKALVDRSRSGLKTTTSGHLKGGSGSAGHKLVQNREQVDLNGNSVQIDQEMLKLSKIQLGYGLVTQLYSKHKQMQQVVTGGGR